MGPAAAIRYIPAVGELVPDSSRALIGAVTSGPVTAEITAKESQRYAQAVDDLNPIYFDEAAARAAGYRTLVAPPTFVDHAVVVGRPVSEVREDGMFKSPGRQVAIGLKRVMFGGQEWDFVSPVYVGDTITATQRLAAIDEKSGSKGPFVLVSWETEFVNQDGNLVARSRLQGISR
jgi:acyl dehydratase